MEGGRLGDVREDLRSLSDSNSASRARLRFFRTLPLRVKGFMPPFGLGAGGAEVGVSETVGGGSSTTGRKGAGSEGKGGGGGCSSRGSG